MKKTTRNAMAGIMAAAMAAFTGCSTAGPFVTNISSDGKGDLVVERNTVHINPLTGVISMDDNPTTQVIKVVPEPQSQPK